MPASDAKKLGNHGGKSVAKEVQDEVKAMKETFKRISGDKKSIINFLSKAGIVTPQGKLAEKYR